jgi:hypothetical protein
MTEWVKCSDREPDGEQEVEYLVTNGYSIGIGTWAGNHEWWGYLGNGVKYWMPLPPIPKETE